MESLFAGNGEVLTKVRLPQTRADAGYAIHPAFLDACLHAYPFVITNAEQPDGICWLPVSLERFWCRADGVLDDAWVHTRLRQADDRVTQTVDIRAYDATGGLTAEMHGLKLRPLKPRHAPGGSQGRRRLLFGRVAEQSAEESPSANAAKPAPGSCLPTGPGSRKRSLSG